MICRKLIGYKVDCLFSGQESASRRNGLEGFRSGKHYVHVTHRVSQKCRPYKIINSLVTADASIFNWGTYLLQQAFSGLSVAKIYSLSNLTDDLYCLQARKTSS